METNVYVINLHMGNTNKYKGKSIIIHNAVVLVFLLAALIMLRRWHMRDFIVIISAHV